MTRWTRADLARPGLQSALVALASIAVYANSLLNGFASDDVPIIAENPRVHQLDDLGRILATPYWPMNGVMLGLYRPLTVLGFAVQWAISGGEPWLFHAVNVAAHAAISVLVLLLVRRFASAQGAFAGALLFALHPLHTEAVANIVGQAELWAALAVVGACLLFVAREPDEPLGFARLVAIAALYAFGLFAKEHAIVLPALLVVLEAARHTQSPRAWLRRHGAWALPGVAVLGAVAVAYLAVRVDVLGSITAINAGPQYPFLREEFRVFSALRAWPEYMRLLFFPLDLSADYSPAVILPVEGVMTPMMILGLAILVGLVVFAVVTPRRPRVGLPPAWFFITVLPVSNLLFPIGVLLADRVLYLPSVALAFLVAFLFDRVAEPSTARGRSARPAALAWTAVAIVALAFGVRTVSRNPVWASNETVIASVIREHPESYKAQYNAGVLALKEADTAAAVYHWELATRLWDRDANLLSRIGSFYLTVENYERAHQLLRSAFELHPDLLLAVTGLAVAELGIGNPAEALRLSQYGLSSFGVRPEFFDIRGRALLALDRPEEAAASFRTAIRLGSDDWVHWGLLARSLIRVDSTGAAAAALDSALVRSRAEGDSAATFRLSRARRNLAPS